MTKNDHHRETTSMALFGGPKAVAPGGKCFVCIGAARGGTSMVAGAMQALGVNMGENLSDTHEDPAFSGRSVAAMVQEIERRKALGLSHWGWKFPNAANYLEKLRPHLANPHLVIVMRDPVATAKGHMRWHGRDDLHALSDIFLTAQRNFYLCLTWQVPALLVSYEKALAYPGNFITEFCAFAGLAYPGNGEDIEAFMRPGSYKKAPVASR
jgi:hypothetical protein